MKLNRFKKLLVATTASAMLVGAMTGCGTTEKPAEEKPPVADSGSDTATDTETEAPAEETALSGEIVVLTNRTDVVDTDFVEYAAKFNEIHPDVEVKFEAYSDYEGQVKVRMNTDDYGDVFLIPNGVNLDQLPDFMEPLGTVDEMSEKYQFVTEKAYEGVVYGLPLTINAQGIVYNKAVFEEAGITELPSTPEEYIAALTQIQQNTDAIPYYTNYAAGWTLNQFEGMTRGIFGNANYSNEMVHMDSIFGEGTAHNIVYGLMYDMIEAGLIEEDPFTTDWEMSKQMIAEGKIATMPLGSWAISQIKGVAVENGLNPDDIGYMPFPYTAEDGNMYAAANGDYKIGVSKHSENKEAALAFMYFFLEESGYVEAEGGISVVKGRPMPETLSAYEELGVILVEAIPAPAEEAGLLDKIDNQAEVGFYQDIFKKRMVESAVGNTDETFEDICADLDAKWAAARQELVK